MHLHPSVELYYTTGDDRWAVTTDFISIVIESIGLLGFTVSPVATVAMEVVQGYLDWETGYGAGEGLANLRDYHHNAGFTSDDILATAAIIPAIGMATDLADIASHSLGVRVRWAP